MLSDHRKQTDFLKQCLHYGDSAERDLLAEKVARLQLDERCVWRAVRLMVLIAALAFAGLGYGAVFVADFPQSMSQVADRLVVRILCAMGVGATFSAVAFVGVGVMYRQALNHSRDECRRLATTIMEARLGRSSAPVKSVVSRVLE
jgi:hypothetical protein